jgi:hypothetical protein
MSDCRNKSPPIGKSFTVDLQPRLGSPIATGKVNSPSIDNTFHLVNNCSEDWYHRTMTYRFHKRDGRYIRRTTIFNPILITLFVAVLFSGYYCQSGSCESPIAADSVVDSIGVNIHLHFGDTVYGNFPLIESLLKNLGVRHTRDGLIDTTWQAYYDRHIALGKLGIRCIFITNPAESDAVLVNWPRRVPGAFEGYEAPNEFDNGRNANWAQTINAFMPRLYHAVKSDPETARYPVIGPSVIRPPDFAPLSGISSDFDFANLHNYFAGRNPGTGGWGANGYGSIAFNMNLASSAWPGKPMMTTETGYYTDAGHDSIPEQIEGEYVPRLVLEQMLHGIKRTYFYELIDENTTAKSNEGYFGLAHVDGSPKPAYTALKGMIALFADPGPAFALRDFDFTLDGAPANVHHMLAAKRDGSYYLAIWIEAQNYDVNKKQATPSTPIEVTLASRHTFATAEVIQFGEDGSPSTKTIKPGANIPLIVSDRIVVLHLK